MPLLSIIRWTVERRARRTGAYAGWASSAGWHLSPWADGANSASRHRAAANPVCDPRTAPDQRRGLAWPGGRCVVPLVSFTQQMHKLLTGHRPACRHVAAYSPTRCRSASIVIIGHRCCPPRPPLLLLARGRPALPVPAAFMMQLSTLGDY